MTSLGLGGGGGGGGGGGAEKPHLRFSRGPLSSFILARLNPGLSNA